jgi:hypothetical protein
MKEKLTPDAAMTDALKNEYDREAQEDIDEVINGQVPDEPDDITGEYIDYLNEWLLTDKYTKLQQKNPEAAARVSQFIDAVIEKAHRKVVKLSMQAPNPLEQPPQPVPGTAPDQGSPQQPPGMPVGPPGYRQRQRHLLASPQLIRLLLNRRLPLQHSLVL